MSQTSCSWKMLSQWKIINTHMHTHTYTHTHARTHARTHRAACAIDKCIEYYVGDTSRCIVERAKDHNDRDEHFYIVKHSFENNQ